MTEQGCLVVNNEKVFSDPVRRHGRGLGRRGAGVGARQTVVGAGGTRRRRQRRGARGRGAVEGGAGARLAETPAAAAAAAVPWRRRRLRPRHHERRRRRSRHGTSYANEKKLPSIEDRGQTDPVTILVKSEGSPYSTAELKIPELIPVLGSQPAGDVSHKPGSRLPLLSARPAVTLATLKRVATNFAGW